MRCEQQAHHQVVSRLDGVVAVCIGTGAVFLATFFFAACLSGVLFFAAFAVGVFTAAFLPVVFFCFAVREDACELTANFKRAKAAFAESAHSNRILRAALGALRIGST